MILTWLFSKLKGFVLFFINILRRALCCIRKRKRSYSESVPLTHVVSGTESSNDLQDWSDWGKDNGESNKPKTIQDYIDLYREQTVKSHNQEPEESEEQDLNFFEDMTPKITRQAKVLIRNKNDPSSRNVNSRLAAREDTATILPTAELREWDENSGWGGEQLLDQEAQKILREQKRLDRERRVWEQNQRKLEKNSKALGSKLTT
ncbi:receptor-binding cancer antigen expressed on SiSo cells [Sitophilus oryzae]|uniref:Receptor-binding cancer antigen expressed on SiSo cells n=1 Tax=Sitophilus oryzae TaxID=7048 RepID=A0A6J2Y1M8_SITOR|nr:receptor-binding cancer antigen expressed on SiSo cells [Sitophilus oryzae]